MPHRTPTRASLVFLLFLILIIPPSYAQGNQQPLGKTVTYAPGEPIIIGFSGLLSSDIEPQTDEDLVKALRVALLDNPTVTVGGVEFALELLPQEDACTDVGGRESAAAFISNKKVIGVIGPTCSSACRTMSVMFEQSNYTTISPSCTASNLARDFNSFHRLIANDDAQGVEGAIFVLDYLGYTQIAVVNDGTDYGAALADIFSESIASLGADVVYDEAISRFQTDFSETVLELEAAEPEFIYFAGLAGEAAGLLKALRASETLSEVEFMITDGAFGRDFIQLAGAQDAQGVYASQPTAPDTDALDLFNAKFVRQYGRPPNTTYHPYAVDALTIFRAAIEAVGVLDDAGNLVIDRLKFRTYVSTYGQGGAPVQGLSGDLLCNGDGECALGGISFYQVGDGRFNLLDASLTIDLGF